MLLSLAGGMAGGFLKPNLYLVILAIIVVEFFRILTDFRNLWKFLILTICALICMSIGAEHYTEKIISEIGLEFNPEIEASWHHYFLMGLNEETTGGYCSDDVAIFGQYQESKEERTEAEIQLAIERIKDRGFTGTLYFWLKKMVMTFNDGTFGWRAESYADSYYSPDLASDTSFTDLLRNIYWEGPYVGAYNTICQLVWIFVLLCITGICFCKGTKLEKFFILSVCFLGLFLYQLLFEARARYLFVFLPLLISMSSCVIENYCDLLIAKKKRL